ncbi:hypothetical protein ACHAXT_010002 [Thalassiosira profunda]
MAELPTPHSIAIGTLISLWADPKSPLVVLDWHDGDAAMGLPGPKTREWTTGLMSLLQRLVLTEDEGVVVLPNGDRWGRGGDGGANPAEDGGPGVGGALPLPEHNWGVLDADELFFQKHALDGKDILDDVLGRFGSSLPTTEESKVDGYIDGGHLCLSMEPLSSLLDRIDEAFTSSPPRSSGPKRRTPPSLALLSRLQMASASVDDLMNLLDEWHAMLEGSHIGYPPPSGAGTNVVSIDGESTFGVYLRKLSLGMEEIPFEAMARLWDALREFVGEEAARAEEMWTEQRDDQDGFATSDLWLPSSPQIERIVRKTCLDNNLDALLRPVGGDAADSQNSLSAPPSPHPYMNLLETHPECPSLHFLIFLHSLANGNRSEALESLHRYFDFAMIHERKERAERTILLQTFGGGDEGVGGHGNASSGLTFTMASGMGGITGGMTGGIINGAAVGGPQQGPGQRGGAGAAGANNQMGKIFKESNVMQYAAVLLAQTYYRFGYTQLALQATEEAVRVAQQSGDEECVSFANGWLALINSSLGGGGATGGQSVYASIGGLVQHGTLGNNYRPLAAAASPATIGNRSLSQREEEAMLQRCQGRASERGLTSLAAGASLELARRMVYQRQSGDGDVGGLGSSEEDVGGSSLAWASIKSAGRMPVAGSSSSGRVGGVGAGVGASASAAASAATDIYNMNPTESGRILGQQNIATTGLWASTGHSSLASLSSCAALYGPGSANEEAMNRVFASFVHGPGMDVWAAHRSQSSSDNQPGEAYAAMLNNAISLAGRNSASEESWISSSSAILHEWSVRSYDLPMAQGLNTLLANQAALPLGEGALASVEATLVYLSQSTHLCIQQGEYERAKASARRACWLASRHGLLFQQGWHLLQLALIELEVATSSQSTPLPVENALPPLLECLQLSELHSIDPLHAIALATLAKVFLCMDRYKKARAMLQAAMPLVTQHGHVWFQGEAHLTLAKCNLAEATHLKSEENQEASYDTVALELHESALSELKQAALHFEKIEDICRLRQVYYLMARVCHSLDAQKKRDEAAKMFAKLSEEKRERSVHSVMAASNAKQSGKQWEALRSVMITTPEELRACVHAKLQR